MVQCSKCPIAEECTVYSKWVKEGEEICQWINGKSLNTIQIIFDTDSVPEWFGICPLVKML